MRLSEYLEKPSAGLVCLRRQLSARVVKVCVDY